MRKDVEQGNAVLSLWLLYHNELQLQGNTVGWLPGVFVKHTGLLQKVNVENYISEQFLAGRKEGIIYLPGILPSCIAPLFMFNSTDANSHVLPGCVTQPLIGHACGKAFHPNLEVEVEMQVEDQPREQKGHSQENLRRHAGFVSNIPLKNSMQESDMVWQHCGGQLREGSEWM